MSKFRAIEFSDVRSYMDALKEQEENGVHPKYAPWEIADMCNAMENGMTVEAYKTWVAEAKDIKDTAALQESLQNFHENRILQVEYEE